MFAEFLEAHGQEKILNDIKDENKVEAEESSQEKTDEEPANNIANADISDFEVGAHLYILYIWFSCLFLWHYNFLIEIF